MDNDANEERPPPHSSNPKEPQPSQARARDFLETRSSPAAPTNRNRAEQQVMDGGRRAWLSPAERRRLQNGSQG